MKAINDLNIPNLVPLDGDISNEELAEKAGAAPEFLGLPHFSIPSGHGFSDV